MKMHVLQERIERDEYEVDPQAVADAIVARLSARTLTTDPTRPTS
jgi:hypothetical protein